MLLASANCEPGRSPLASAREPIERCRFGKSRRDFLRRIVFESIHVCARRRVSIGAVADSAIRCGFLAASAPGIGQSGHSSEGLSWVWCRHRPYHHRPPPLPLRSFFEIGLSSMPVPFRPRVFAVNVKPVVPGACPSPSMPAERNLCTVIPLTSDCFTDPTKETPSRKAFVRVRIPNPPPAQTKSAESRFSPPES